MEKDKKKDVVSEETVEKKTAQTVVEETPDSAETETKNTENGAAESADADTPKVVDATEIKAKGFAAVIKSKNKVAASVKENEKDAEAEKENEGRYRAMVHTEPNLWTYGSPILIEDGVLERDTVSNKNRLTLKFTNLYQQAIRDVYLVIVASDKGGHTDEIVHTYKALGQEYLQTKGKAAKIAIRNEDARTFKVRIEQIVFENGTTWKKADADLESVGTVEDVETFATEKSKEYEQQYQAGKDAIAKDHSESIQSGMETLKEIVWYKDSKEVLRDAKKKLSITKQNEERKQASENRRANRQKAVRKKYMTAGIIVVVLAVIAAISVVVFFTPNKKYNAAKKLIQKEQYEKAIDAFHNLHGFRKSEEYLAQAYYNLGLQTLADGDEQKASDYFEKSFDADEDSQYGVMAGAFLDYYEGEEALAANDYKKALQLFQSSADAASDFNLINKASAGTAQISYSQGDYETAWNTIKNVFAKDTAYSAQYGEYGYGYAKSLIDAGKIEEGMEIYNAVAKYSKSADLNKGVYAQAVKLAEDGKIEESLNLLKQIKKGYSKADKLYKSMAAFDKKVKLWLGTWTHTGKVDGEKTTYTIVISELLYKGEMCLKIKDKNNKYLGFETVISSKNHVTQIEIGEYMLHFKLKKFHDQKFTFTMLEGRKMLRELKYGGEKYSTKYKKKAK